MDWSVELKEKCVIDRVNLSETRNSKDVDITYKLLKYPDGDNLSPLENTVENLSEKI